MRGLHRALELILLEKSRHIGYPPRKLAPSRTNRQSRSAESDPLNKSASWFTGPGETALLRCCDRDEIRKREWRSVGGAHADGRPAWRNWGVGGGFWARRMSESRGGVISPLVYVSVQVNRPSACSVIGANTPRSSSLDPQPTMHFRPFLALALPLLSGVAAQSAGSNETAGPDENGKYWIHGTGISAAFIPYGASITDFLIKDKNGVERDIVAGFDNATYYEIDEQHPHYGSVPGRYANRIKNSTFEVDGETFHTPANDNPTEEYPDGVDTLHGGPNGWDFRNFSVVAHTENSITFSIVDPDGEQGFPGEVVSLITYTLTGMTWDFQMVAVPTTKATPIMLSSHAYWNLDGFANDEVVHALNHTVHMPYSDKRVGVDSILIPTGEILENEEGSVNDFWSEPRQLGKGFSDPEIEGNCGEGCAGYGRHLSPPCHPRRAPVLTDDRQLLHCLPRGGGARGLAQLLRHPCRLRVVRHRGPDLHRPGRLPDLLVRRRERHPGPQAVAGPFRRARLPPRHPAIRLRRARGAGLDRRDQPPRVGEGGQADLPAWRGSICAAGELCV